ncbi:craniofacial development protein 2-like [Coccinella septempunctata]|uniref:craniofacial development protein 2-like n=1 Tax=Coccinella septempunctata TaxID=41139 RepID=UPI001D09516E|nr:craniofacial development protein 2-like [Coccinella septempunctata]
MSTFNSKYSGCINSSSIGSPGRTVLNVSFRKANLRKPLGIGTGNVRSLFEAGKQANLTQEMNRLKLDILGVAETWWPDAGECEVQNGVFFYSGNSDSNTGKVIQVYAPTADSTEHELKKFDEVQELLRLTKKQDVNIILGDFNAKIGNVQFEEIVGPYGLGETNERGDRLLQFCQEESMTTTNTFFQLHSRRLYTWKSPADRPHNVIRNQIDFILINRRFSSTIKRASTYPGADVPSDHVLLMGVMKISLSSQKKPTSQRRMALEGLRDPVIKAEISDEINRQFKQQHRILEKNYQNLGRE